MRRIKHDKNYRITIQFLVFSCTCSLNFVFDFGHYPESPHSVDWFPFLFLTFHWRNTGCKTVWKNTKIREFVWFYLVVIEIQLCDPFEFLIQL